MLPLSAFGSGHLYRKHPGMLTVRPTHHILENYSNYVVLRYNADYLVNYLNNQFEKHNLSNLEKYLSEFDKDFYKKLGDTTSTWAIREVLSISIKDMLEQDTTQMDIISNDSQITCCYISPEDFLEHPVDNLEHIYQFFGLEFNQYHEQIKSSVSIYLANQRNLIKHIRLNDFILATINNQEIILSEPTLIDEAYIQAKLAMLGYSIRCYGLDVFPQSSIELHRLLDK